MTSKSRLQKAPRPEAAVEDFGVGAVGRFFRPAEVERHSLRVGPLVEFEGDEFGALVSADRLRVANPGAHLLQCPDRVLGAIAELGI